MPRLEMGGAFLLLSVMRIPIVLLVGQANSGKDTIAKMMIEHRNASVLAFADPIKRLARFIFDLKEEYLWGPSRTRNTVIDAFQDDGAWEMAYGKILLMEKLCKEKSSELENLLPEDSFPKLKSWFSEFRKSLNDKDITPRVVLQSLGTEFGRAYNKQIWTDIAIANCISLLSGGCSYTSQKGLAVNEGASDMVVISDGRFRNEILAVKSVGGLVVKVECPQAGGDSSHASEVEQKNIPKHFFDFTIANDKSKGFQALREDVEVLLKKVF